MDINKYITQIQKVSMDAKVEKRLNDISFDIRFSRHTTAEDISRRLASIDRMINGVKAEVKR